MATNGPPRKPNPSANKQKPKPPEALQRFLRGWVWWIVFALLLLWNVITFFGPRGESTVNLSYTDFLARVRAGNVFLGRDLIQKRDVAEQTAAKLDEATSNLLAEAHEQATRIVASHRDQLDLIVAQLLEHETISGDEVRRIVGDPAQPQPPVQRPASTSTGRSVGSLVVTNSKDSAAARPRLDARVLRGSR